MPGEFILDKSIHWKYLSDEERKRQEAILEFLSTEANYHERLITLYKVFYLNTNKLLSDTEISKIFQNLPDLITFSSILLADLRSRQAECKGIISSISDIFLNHVKSNSFECLRTYCIGHEEGSRFLAERSDSNGKLTKFLKEAVNDPRCSCLDLASFLLEPVQRLARYPLLLKQILHYTEKNHKDHEAALTIVLRSEELLQSINESVRRQDSLSRLWHIQSHLVPLDGEVVELAGQTKLGVERNVIHEGIVWKCRSKRKLSMILLTDMILLLESLHNKLALYRPPLSLDEIALREVNFELLNLKLSHGLNKDCTFEILRGSQSVCVATETVTDKERWFREFEKAKKALCSGRKAITMQLPCMGTLQIITSLKSSTDISILLELNMQRVSLRPGQQTILSMSSYDNVLRINTIRTHKYAPDQVLGYHDLSLDFIEYYGERSTDQFIINAGPHEIGLVLQFRAA